MVFSPDARARAKTEVNDLAPRHCGPVLRQTGARPVVVVDQADTPLGLYGVAVPTTTTGRRDIQNVTLNTGGISRECHFSPAIGSIASGCPRRHFYGVVWIFADGSHRCVRLDPDGVANIRRIRSLLVQQSIELLPHGHHPGSGAIVGTGDRPRHRADEPLHQREPGDVLVFVLPRDSAADCHGGKEVGRHVGLSGTIAGWKNEQEKTAGK